MKKLWSFLLALTICVMLAAPAFAEDYTYTVRFYSGGQGTFGGQEVVVYSNLKYGSQVSFNQRSVTLNDGSKYYVKGIRESGKDNNTVGYSSFKVTQDQDYVVAYGILGDSVAYTINYVDADGNTLAPSETYYGNIGDKPVVSYLYIEGYQPRYYNITGTLAENAADNDWTFVYTPVVAPAVSPAPSATTAAGGTGTAAAPAPDTAGVAGTAGTTGTGTQTGTGTDTGTGTETGAGTETGTGTEPAGTGTETGTDTATGTDEGPAGTSNQAQTPSAPATVEEQPGGTGTNPEPDSSENVPEEILDMDTPLAEFNNPEDSTAEAEGSGSDVTSSGEDVSDASRVSVLPIAAGIAAVVLAVVVILILVRNKKKKVK